MEKKSLAGTKIIVVLLTVLVAAMVGVGYWHHTEMSINKVKYLYYTASLREISTTAMADLLAGDAEDSYVILVGRETCPACVQSIEQIANVFTLCAERAEEGGQALVKGYYDTQKYGESAAVALRDTLGIERIPAVLLVDDGMVLRLEEEDLLSGNPLGARQCERDCQSVLQYVTVGEDGIFYFDEAGAYDHHEEGVVISAGLMLEIVSLRCAQSGEPPLADRVRFPIYGNFCGPNYGGEDEEPVDFLDAACQAHDGCFASEDREPGSCEREFIAAIAAKYDRMDEEMKVYSLVMAAYFQYAIDHDLTDIGWVINSPAEDNGAGVV